MIKDIDNKNININVSEKEISLPLELKNKIKTHFTEYSIGKNVWNGDIWTTNKIEFKDDEIKINLAKTDYAHYLYCERIGVEEEFRCNNLSAGTLIETKDGYYIVGELIHNSSYAGMLQVPGGNFDINDINDNSFWITETIKREVLEEINIDVENSALVNEFNIKYIRLPNKNEFGIQIFAKVILNINYDEVVEIFNSYTKKLELEEKEIEFSRLHAISTINPIRDIGELNNPKRQYFEELLTIDSKKGIEELER